MADFVRSKKRLSLSPGDPQSTISGIESDRISLGVERAKKLAIAMGVHPAVLLFPDWKLNRSSVA
ncbi:MAG: helix-turn-helix transcriptional regulator [Bdellovibrionales bacterium]